MSFFTTLLDTILPPRTTDRVVRNTTLSELQILVNAQTGMLPYHDPRVTALIWELKYYANPYAVKLAGEILYEQLLTIAAEELGIPLLIPVPMHQKRRRARGHNQTEVLCKHVMCQVGSAFHYMPQALERTVDTHPQQELERHVRLQNVRDSMKAPEPVAIAGRVCVVIDDVTTTGATLEEARRALYNAGAARVYLLALAQS